MFWSRINPPEGDTETVRGHSTPLAYPLGNVIIYAITNDAWHAVVPSFQQIQIRLHSMGRLYREKVSDCGNTKYVKFQHYEQGKGVSNLITHAVVQEFSSS